VTHSGLSRFREGQYDETKTLDIDKFDPKKLNDVEFN
jgi:hypothetical protein